MSLPIWKEDMKKANSKGSGKPAHLYNLPSALAVHMHYTMGKQKVCALVL